MLMALICSIYHSSYFIAWALIHRYTPQKKTESFTVVSIQSNWFDKLCSGTHHHNSQEEEFCVLFFKKP